MIKKLTLFTLFFCFLMVQLVAQDNKAFPLKFAFRHSDTLRANQPIGAIVNIGATVYNPVTNEFWMCSSHNDSVMRFSLPSAKYLGAFRVDKLVAPITNTTRYFRGLTVKDNYFIWGLNNTDTVRKLDPRTGQEVARFVLPKWIGNQSYITFDSTKGGAFWISGTFGAIRRIDSTFTTVSDSIIVDGSFNMGGYTAMAFDAMSPGGPYMWFLGSRHPETIQFGIQNSFVTATQVSIATKFRTGVQKTIVDDFTFLLNTNQAGRSLTLARIPGLSKPVMLISTGKFSGSTLTPTELSGVTAAYELSSSVLPDAALDSVIVTPNYSMLPQQFVRPLSISAKVRNAVNNTTTAGNVRFVTRSAAGDTLNNQVVPFSTNPSTAAFIAAPNQITVSNLKKGVNSIKATSIVSTDPVAKNDTLSGYFAISDSTVARDYVDFYDIRALESFIYGGSSSLYHTLGTGVTSLIPERPEIGQGYKLDWPITITSATVRIRPFASGDTTRVKVYTLDANGKPKYAGQSGLYVITPGDSAAQVMKLPLTAPVTIPAGQAFMMSVTEGFNAPAVWGTPMGYEKGMTFVHALQTFGGWVAIDTLPLSNYYATRFNRALAIRPNIRLRTDIGETTNIGKLALAPNPTSGVINLEVEMHQAEDLVVRVMNLSGQIVFAQKFEAIQSLNQSLDLSEQANGMYIVTLTTSKGTLTRKVVKE
ncbi:MAG: T9SS type A sorting domain-containing protein [Saprospiraceae bacterium]|nr:T9SS type A sorting domain-containing protein [Saprospiraceae bacterium]